uniref:Uncharacterized protein n=1 Tax=viral metagenome TaxID=1070528 RepID=A0A6H1Z6W3_9ZZZZ
MDEDLKAIIDLVDKHREKAVITCDPTCWCWYIEETLANLDLDGYFGPDTSYLDNRQL